MIYNSYTFLLFFLLTAVIFYKARSTNTAIILIIIASIIFYAWFNVKFLFFLIPAIFINYLFGKLLIFYSQHPTIRRMILFISIAANLGILIYFKYSNFIIQNVNYFATEKFSLLSIAVPMGVSFFVFQKIAFLVDTYKGQITDLNLKKFLLFSTFFPPLIAGPLFHYREIAPQCDADKNIFKLNSLNIVLGLTLFTIGIFKKVMLADTCAIFSDEIFNRAASGEILGIANAWIGALAYTFQLYFDFSGYSDMATGVARIFNIALPINFNAPYLSPNLVTFWRRWHITLSRFFKDYLYIPLGGNKGKIRKFINLMIVMSLCGLWHGASWNFVIWGTLHGLLLSLNHGFQSLTRLSLSKIRKSFMGYWISVLFTFTVVVTLWVIFRAVNLTTALSIIKSMYGINGLVVFQGGIRLLLDPFLLLTACFGIVWLLPSISNFFREFSPYLEGKNIETLDIKGNQLTWSISPYWAALFSLMFTVSFFFLSKISSFIYFNF